jgi:hypothetical protein
MRVRVDKHNAFWLTVIAGFLVYVGIKVHNENAMEETNAAYVEVCTRSGGVPLVVGQTRLCFTKSATLAIIPVYAQ